MLDWLHHFGPVARQKLWQYRVVEEKATYRTAARELRWGGRILGEDVPLEAHSWLALLFWGYLVPLTQFLLQGQAVECF